MSKVPPLAEEARKQLFSRVNLVMRAGTPRDARASDATSIASRRTDFSTLPGYEELRLY
jgi:hypothetical protein